MTLIRHSELRHPPEEKDPANPMQDCLVLTVVLKIVPYSKSKGYENG